MIRDDLARRLDHSVLKPEASDFRTAATLAVQDGAAEVDMVMNVGTLKSGRNQAVAGEIADPPFHKPPLPPCPPPVALLS